MEARKLAVSLLALFVLLVSVQVLFTDVGVSVAPEWSSSTTVAAVEDDPETVIADAAVASGDRFGAIAWVTRSDDRWVVSVARVTLSNGSASVERRTQVASSPTELAGVDVAVAGDDVVLVWERVQSNEVVLHSAASNRTRVLSGNASLVDEPTVAARGDRPVAGWQAYRDGEYEVRVVSLADAPSGGTVGRPVDGYRSPRLVPGANTTAVVWVDPDAQALNLSTGRWTDGAFRVSASGSTGPARAPDSIGGGGGQVAIDAARNGSSVRVVWSDIAAIKTARFDAAESGDPVRLGSGKRPAVAARDGAWLATWLVESRTTGFDVAYRYVGAGESSGTLSRLPSNAYRSRPLFAPDPGVAWVERGGGSRLLVSPYRPDATATAHGRLASTPARFVFIAVAAAAIGVVTLPMMPWVVLSLLAAFLVTTTTVSTPLLSAGARVRSLLGRSTDGRHLRETLAGAPALAWVVAFALVETAVFVLLQGDSGPLHAAGGLHPVAVSAGALLATVLLSAVGPVRSPWRLAVLFAYLQTAALWAALLPNFL